MNKREPPSAKPIRKPYRRPVLERYGSVRSLTKVTSGVTGANDMAIMSNKTGL